jgi:hypothetical protein
MDGSMPEEDRAGLIEQLERDSAEEWMPTDEGNFQDEEGC